MIERIVDYWRAGGGLLVPLALVCFLVWRRYLAARAVLQSAVRTPAEFASELESRWRGTTQLPAVADWLGTQPGAAAAHARGICLRMVQGITLEAAVRDSRDAFSAIEKRSFEILAALVAAAPLLGLLGTILGMIQTFEGVALRSGHTTHLVADGISQALITTQVGLVAAVPGAFGLAHLRRLRNRLSNELDLAESQIRMLAAARNAFATRPPP